VIGKVLKAIELEKYGDEKIDGYATDFALVVLYFS
jgi:hypothetical protein